MKWNKYTLKTTAEAEEIVTAALTDAGIEGVEIVDYIPLTDEELEGMFGDVSPMAGPDDGTATLSFYLDPKEDNEAALARVREELDALRGFMEIGPCEITASETEDKDWINNWKEFFHSFRVDNIFIVPSWEDDTPLPTDELVLHIDPGTAFGTGLHETTQLCIRQLKKRIRPGDKLLDVGTGSGILSIVALKLGAKYALGTDLDPCAVDAVKDNKAVNGIRDEDFDLVIGNILDEPKVQEQCGTDNDIVVANILANVLVPLAPEAYRHVRSGGIFITSGIIDNKEEEVAKALVDAGFVIEETTFQGEWVSITARKP